MQKAELQQQAVALIEQLSTEELEVVVDLLVDPQNNHARDSAAPSGAWCRNYHKENLKKLQTSMENSG